jgi:TP901 family phage tail tape measure protein
MSLTRSVVVNIIGRDNASSSFLRVSKAADKAANSADRAVARFASHAKKMQAIGQTMSKSITLPLLALGGVAVDQAVKFQKAITVLHTATGEATKNLGAVSSGVKKIAVDTGTSLGSLTDGMYLAEKAGYSLSKGGLTVLKAAAQGAKAENVDLSIAMTALTSIMTSYGLKAKDAVGVENELIVGSGLAKTTMTDFANSLSNVVPLAAGLHISFAQVAGAIATMTQHGESAQRATENLSNLITNLAGSNNVATNAMQQLGINTVDLQKNLGKRGLSGSLAIVLDALKKHGKAGMVVYDSFKKSSLATVSLREELAKMTGPLKTNSKAFLDGKESYKDYQKFFRGIGGKGFALGSQFAASVKSFLGFNNQIRAGRGDRQTYAKWLQQALGGVTGLKAMLMLLGGNFAKEGSAAGSFAGRAKKVADAAKEGGKNVHGWAEISKTASVKFDKMKAKLQVLAETIGEKLLPYVVKVVEGIGHLVDKFDSLSGTQKKMIGWGLLIVAAMGPVLAIAGRVGFALAGAFRIGIYVVRFIKGIAMMNVAMSTYNTSAFQTGFKMRAAFSGARSSVGMLGGALMGVAIGTSWGLMVRNSGTAQKAIAVLGSTAAGALSGAMVAGAPGAVVGGVAGLISSVITAFSGEGDAAKKAKAVVVANLQEQNVVAEQLLQTLLSVNGAMNSKDYKTTVLDKLRDNGLLEKANAAGLKPQDLVSEMLGKPVSGQAENAYGKFLAQLAGQGDTGKKLINELNNITLGAAHGEKEWELYQQALGKTITPSKLLRGGLKNLGKEFSSLKTEGFAGSKIVNSFSAVSLRNTAALKDNLTYLQKTAAEQLLHGKSVKDVTKAYEQQKAALANQLMLMGANGQVVAELIGKYGKLTQPQLIKLETSLANGRIKTLQGLIEKYGKMHPSPKIDAKTAAAEAEIKRLKQLLADLRDKTVNVTVVPHASPRLGDPSNPGSPAYQPPGKKGGKGKKGHAAGGYLSDGWFTVGERGWELGRKVGSKVEIYDNKVSQKMTGWGDRVPGYSKGTSASKAASKAQQQQDTLSQKVTDALGLVGQAYSAPFDTSQVGLPRLAGQIAHAIKVLRSEVDKGLKKSLAEGFEKQIKRLAKIAEKQLAAIRLRIKKSDLAAISKGLKSSVDDGKTAYDALLADMKAAGASAAKLHAVRVNESAALKNDARLLAAKDYRNTIADTLKGNFDSTQYGSVQDLLTGFGGASSTNRSYARELTSLRHRARGNKGLLAYINQLAASGQTTTLQTLYGANAGELNQVGKAASGYAASIAAGSNAAEVTKFGASVDQLVVKQDHLADVLLEVTHAFLKNSAKPIHLHMHVNGKEIAAEVVHTKEFDKELAALLDAVVNHHTYKH